MKNYAFFSWFFRPRNSFFPFPDRNLKYQDWCTTISSNYRLDTSLNLTDDLAGLESTGIPDLPKTRKVSGRKPRIIAQTMSGNYQVISCGTKVTLDPVMKKIGIWIPEMVRTTFFPSLLLEITYFFV